MKQSYLWIDGEFVRDSTPELGTLGSDQDSVAFADIRSYETSLGPALFRLSDHISELLSTAEHAGVQVGYTFEDLWDSVQRTMAFNGIRAGHVRPRFVKNDSLHRYRQQPSESASTSLVIAASEAVPSSQDPVIPDHAALFIVDDGIITTPPSARFGNSIIRQSVITLASDLGFAVTEQMLQPDQILRADEAFLSIEIGEIQPLLSFDESAISEGEIGPVTQALVNAFSETTQGRGRRSAEWLEWLDEAYLGM
jgi:branched-chain amino acid aminotransferase